MRVLQTLICIAYLGAHTAGLGQATPDAGSFRQQLQAIGREAPTKGPAAEVKNEQPEIVEPEGPTVAARSFRFEGNSLLSSEQLARSLAPFQGKNLTFQDLQRLAARVSVEYRKVGRTARVFLPEQDITDGEILFRIVEARFGRVRLEGDPTKLVSADMVAAYVGQGQKSDAPLDNRALDRALLLADDLPGVSVAGTLVAGSKPGTTDILVREASEAAVYGFVALDNVGSRLIGNYRLSASIAANSPTGIGDQLRVDAIQAKGTSYIRGAWGVPIGHDGLRASLSGYYLDYKVTGGPSVLGGTKGHSGNLSLELSYPVVRSSRFNLNIRAGFVRSTFATRFTEFDSNYASTQFSAGMDGLWYDEVVSRAVTAFSVKAASIKMDRARLDPFFGQIGPKFGKAEFALSRTQAIGSRNSISLSLSGQYARKSLDTSEKFFIGGAGSVRAYPASELSGDRGIIASAEWRWSVRPQWSLQTFLDHGSATALPTSFDPSSKTRSMSGFGLGAAWKGPRGLSISASWARRIGGNPNPTVAGTDSDGTLIRNRIWFSSQVSF